MLGGILLVSSLCDVCNAVSRLISRERCLPVVTAVRAAMFFEKQAHFLALPVEVRVVTTELPSSVKEIVFVDERTHAANTVMVIS